MSTAGIIFFFFVALSMVGAAVALSALKQSTEVPKAKRYPGD